jgi:hypothetical protein
VRIAPRTSTLFSHFYHDDRFIPSQFLIEYTHFETPRAPGDAMTSLDLRPLSLGELLDRTFFLYRRNFLLFAGISAIPCSLFLIVNLGSTLLTKFRFGGSNSTVPGQFPSAGFGAAAAGGIMVALIVVLAGSIAYLFSVGASVFAVSEIYTGHQTSIRAALRQVRGYAGTIFGVLFIGGLIMGGGFILLIVPGIYLACRICVAVAAALLENLGPSEAIRRSFDLTKNFAGRAFMIYLLYFAMAWGVIAVFQLPFMVMVGVYAKQPQLVTIGMILMQVGSFLGNVLITPVNTIGFALFYYDLRVRKEAFDLQMMMQSIGGAPIPAPITGGVPSMFGRNAS